MARTIKEEDYAARRNEILDAVKRLAYTKGFDHLTIQDILDELNISKGAFYHYFDSKADVMGALIERMGDEEVVPVLKKIVQNSNLTALEKLHAYFDYSARWKTAQKDMIIPLLRVWYSDENALFRSKMFDSSVKKITPLLGEIVKQGIREGSFTTHFPHQFGQVIIYISQGISDRFVDLLLHAEKMNANDPQIMETIADYCAALSDIIERVLGAPEGSIHVIDPAVLQEWFEWFAPRKVEQPAL